MVFLSIIILKKPRYLWIDSVYQRDYCL